VTAAYGSIPADLSDLTAAYIDKTATGSADRRRTAQRFKAEFGDLQRWRACSVTDRLAASEPARAFAHFAAVQTATSLEAGYVVGAASKWGRHVCDRDPAQAARFRLQATSLGFNELEVGKMWSKLAQICVITGRAPETLTADEYLLGREQFWAAVTAKHGKAPKTLCTPLFGLDAVMFHRGQAPKPSPRKPWAARSVPEIGWDQITAAAPVMAATMRRYLDQLAVSLRASSVTCIETNTPAGRRSPHHDQPGGHRRRHHPGPHRGLQDLAGRPGRLPEETPRSRKQPSA